MAKIDMVTAKTWAEVCTLATMCFAMDLRME